ncbi:hypothetical protein ACTNDG_12350 [Clostridium sp. HCP1S3_B4]|uniref:hypothetical protein n=1 Tax=unclassified Clostridium TaxID=2614128 RepID=UPI003F8C2E7C
MINVKDNSIQKILTEMHKKMNKKRRTTANRTNINIILENRILKTICENYSMEPTICAKKLNEKYSYEMNGNDVIRIFRDLRIANPIERKYMYINSENLVDILADALKGDSEKYSKVYNEVFNNKKINNTEKRIITIMLFYKYPEIDIYNDSNELEYLGSTLSKYFLIDIVELIADIYDFKINYIPNKKSPKISLNEAIQKIERLEVALERSDMMLQELQSEFDEQIEESRNKELADFFAQLNSEKYGYILDELLAVRKGVDTLKKNGFDLPVEINGLLIMVKKLIQFVRDSHINPIMKVNNIKQVKASDVEFCIYEGSPFKNSEEVKNVKVISPGWIFKDKEVQISRPKVKEVDGYED